MRRLRFLALAVLAGGMSACASSALLKGLDPESREFVSKVRYIISRDERTVFLRLPEGARKPFIEEFWKRRDPNPDTEANEYRDEYFRRIDEANRLFNEGGGAEPGWLQDRGRIYILIGEPDNRETFPRGVTFYGVPTEIWYYGGFPIVFFDEFWSGSYRLDPLSAAQLSELMSAQMRMKPLVGTQRGALEGRLEIRTGGEGRTALAIIAVPYRKIWFRSAEGRLSTTLAVSFEILDERSRVLAKSGHELALEMSEDDLAGLIRSDYLAEIPLELPPEAAWIGMTLENPADGSRVYKKEKIGNGPDGVNSFNTPPINVIE